MALKTRSTRHIGHYSVTLFRNDLVLYPLCCGCVPPPPPTVPVAEEGVSPCVQKAFAAMLGEDDEELDDEDEDDGDAEWKDIGEHYTGSGAGGGGGSEVTPGDVFALEMELNRENKKMMNVRPAFKNPSRHLLLLS